MMAKIKLPYGIGSIFLVVSSDGVELAKCRVEAMNGKGGVIGRFYVSHSALAPDEALLADGFLWIFGDLHLIKGKWPIIGTNSVPQAVDSTYFKFLGGTSVGGFWISTYDSNIELVSQEKVDSEFLPQLPRDSVRGAAFVEYRLESISKGLKTYLD